MHALIVISLLCADVTTPRLVPAHLNVQDAQRALVQRPVGRRPSTAPLPKVAVAGLLLTGLGSLISVGVHVHFYIFDWTDVSLSYFKVLGLFFAAPLASVTLAALPVIAPAYGLGRDLGNARENMKRDLPLQQTRVALNATALGLQVVGLGIAGLSALLAHLEDQDPSEDAPKKLEEGRPVERAPLFKPSFTRVGLGPQGLEVRGTF